jgi:hypothetical protein
LLRGRRILVIAPPLLKFPDAESHSYIRTVKAFTAFPDSLCDLSFPITICQVYVKIHLSPPLKLGRSKTPAVEDGG